MCFKVSSPFKISQTENHVAHLIYQTKMLTLFQYFEFKQGHLCPKLVEKIQVLRKLTDPNRGTDRHKDGTSNYK